MRSSRLSSAFFPLVIASAIFLSACGGGGTSVSTPPPIVKTTPTITWTQPAPITNPAPLTSTQLNATASVPGSLVYTPAAGTVLPAGNQTLSLAFTPTDTTHYNSASASVTLTVNPPVTVKHAFLYSSETTQDLSGGGINGSFAGLLEVFSIDATSGALTPITGSPFATNYSTSGDMVLSPNGDYGYILAVQYPSGTCCVGTSYILAYALDPATGFPTFKQAIAAGADGGTLTMHPSGTFLYVSPNDSNDSTIGVLSIQSDGTLTLVDSAPFQAQDNVAVNPQGTFLYSDIDTGQAGNWGSNPCGLVNTSLLTYSIDSAGTPAISGSPVVLQRNECPTMPTNYAIFKQVDPSGTRLYVIDGANSTIYVYSIDPSSGALTRLSGTTTTSSFDTSAAVDPLGHFLYLGAVNAFDGFALSASSSSGTLPELPGMPFPLSPSPITGSSVLATDSTGTFLFSNENEYTSAFSCCGPDALVEFKIDSTGAITQLPSSPATFAGTPSKIVASPVH